MSIPIALQLYSVREELARDFDATITQVAAAGYQGVELIYPVPGAPQATVVRRLKELGLPAVAAHMPLPLGDQRNAVLDFMAAYECTTLVSGNSLHDADTLDNLLRVCDRYNEGYAVAKANGLSLALHNHWMEFERLGDRYVYEIMLERLDPGITFELDTYWIRVAGLDPAAIVRFYGDRAPLLHIKDGPGNIEGAMLALGDGVLPLAEVVAAARPHARWLIVELDWCATDMIEAVTASYATLEKQVKYGA